MCGGVSHVWNGGGEGNVHSSVVPPHGLAGHFSPYFSVRQTRNRKLTEFGPDQPHPGSFNVHGIWLDAEENIYLAQFDRVVSKLTRC